MKYRVIIQPPAFDDLDEACGWLAARSTEAAARWLEGMFAAIQTLEANPERCGLAPEKDCVDYEIRQFLCGRGRNVYRVLFTINAGAVRILHVPHAARRFFSPEDFPEEQP
jgi:plasmid stabilization system protein ParE